MKDRPTELDGAALLYFTVTTDGGDFGVAHDLDADQDIPIVSLAICRYSDSPEQVYLFACDANWTVRGDLLYDSVEEAKSDAERYYETGPLTWRAPVAHSTEGDPMTTTSQRMHRALLSLAGLSIGDALGERFFGDPLKVVPAIWERAIPPGPWSYTDDTQMALSIVSTLAKFGTIDQDHLAKGFASRYEPFRGYGGGAHDLLAQFRGGGHWSQLAGAIFQGRGSYGNGAAMRVAPLGAYFADDLDKVVDQAKASAVVTHAHPEGVAGAIAVAVAAAHACQGTAQAGSNASGLLAAVIEHTPKSRTREGLEVAAELPATTPSTEAASILGCGQEVSSQDTVPFALWCAAHHLDNFEEAFWATVAG
ncbi:ADP-ribosylglycohydrolase family protein, partial [Myxococcota bacterium]|nr:ADP-ribosylglycohydrolase family protein [Myxococcota bacterium]